MGYFRSGQVVYTQYREHYADGTGVYQDAPCWNIYIRGASIPDVISYINQLKQCGFSYRSLERRRRTSFFPLNGVGLSGGASPRMPVS